MTVTASPVRTVVPHEPVDPPRKKRGQSPIFNRPGWRSYTLLTVIFAVSVFPLWWSFVIASRQSSDINLVPPALIPGPNFLDNLQKAFATVPFIQALGNSLIIATTITVVVVFFSTLAGFAFAKLKFRGRNALFVAVIATMAIPTQLGIIPLFMTMADWGWIGTLQAVIVPSLASAFGVFFMRQYLVETVPDELIEAARVDGANMWRTYWHVALPAARPAMAILGLFIFIAAWTDYLWPLLVLGTENHTVQTALAALRASGGHVTDHSMVLAGTVLATLPLLLLFFVAGKQLISGIMAGAVKG
jgi:cellobiose transport system permease protein